MALPPVRSFIILAVIFVFSSEAFSSEWQVSLWGKRRAFTEHVEKLAELVKEKSNGEFTLNISYGGLSKNKENLDGISFGAFEMAQFCSFYHRAKNPTITVTELPFLADISLTKQAEISQKVYQHPIVVKDLARWNATLLMPSPLPQYNLVGVGAVPNSLSDFKGNRLRGPGGIAGVMSKLGAVKTGVAATEVRQALSSGVIDIVAFAEHAHMAFGSIEAAKWATTNLNLGTANCPVVVNTDALNSLNKKHRKILFDSVDASLKHYIDNYEGKTIGKYQQLIVKKNIQQITFSAEQVSKLNQLAKSVRNDWIKKNSKKFKSKELFDFTLALFEEK